MNSNTCETSSQESAKWWRLIALDLTFSGALAVRGANGRHWLKGCQLVALPIRQSVFNHVQGSFPLAWFQLKKLRAPLLDVPLKSTLGRQLQCHGGWVFRATNEAERLRQAPHCCAVNLCLFHLCGPLVGDRRLEQCLRTNRLCPIMTSGGVIVSSPAALCMKAGRISGFLSAARAETNCVSPLRFRKSALAAASRSGWVMRSWPGTGEDPRRGQRRLVADRHAAAGRHGPGVQADAQRQRGPAEQARSARPS